MCPEVPLTSVDSNTGKIATQPVVYEQFRYLGSGFAGSVIEARSANGEDLAVKFLKPPVFKQITRDFLWALAADQPYPLEQNERAALFSLLCWQIYAAVANSKIKPEKGIRVNPPLGYFYDGERKAYALVSPFVDGKPGEPVVRYFFGISRVNGITPDQFQTKIKAMEMLAALAREMGMADLARQFEPSTLVSTANVLEKTNGEFVAVDVTPGLCVRFPLSPYDVQVAAKDFRAGHAGRLHFLTVNFQTLERYFEKHPELAEFRPLIEALKELGESPCVDHSVEKKARYVEVWRKRGSITEEEVRELSSENSWPFYWSLAKYLPILDLARKNNRDLIRRTYSDELLVHGKISQELAQKIVSSDRALLKWLFVDKPIALAKDVYREVLLAPARLIVNQNHFIRGWLSQIGCSPTETDSNDQLARLKIENYIRDTVAILALEPLFKVASVTILASLDSRLGALAAILEIPFLFLPVPSPAGILRALYLNLRTTLDLPGLIKNEGIRAAGSYALERLALSLPASLKTIGGFVLPIWLYASGTKEVAAIARHLVDKVMGIIPVFGEKSGLLQQYVFDLCFNIPHSVLARLKIHPKFKKMLR